ncbi:MAG: hypothetical protein LBF60_00510 [Treponema sp.]|jgi:hypothetical protein|nr:hypothetical protein [Treponema sp.]
MVAETSFPMAAGEPVNTREEAHERVGCYMRRRKTGRFHRALKSGRAIGKSRERSVDKTTALILTRSSIAAMTVNMTYAARLMPEAPCSVLLGEEEWKLPYRAANKARKEPKKPYAIKEAVDCLGRLGGLKRAPSDGPPGVKTIWIGLMKLYILLAYREHLA